MSDNNKSVEFIVRQMQTSDCDEVRQILTLLDNIVPNYENECMMKVDAKGMFVAQDIYTGKLMGVCSGVNLSPDLAFVGQYGVRPEYRSLGIGTELWNKIMEHIGPDRNVGLFASEKMVPTYRDKCNFTVIPGYYAIRFVGKVNCNQLIEEIDGISVIDITDDNIIKVIQYDKHVCNGLDRTVLIQEATKVPVYISAVALNKERDVVGYCILKKTCLNQVLPEPIYADNEKIAELLLSKCCQSLAVTQTNDMVYRCFSSNTKSISIAKKLGLEERKRGPLLFTKSTTFGHMERIFCMSSPCFYPY